MVGLLDAAVGQPATTPPNGKGGGGGTPAEDLNTKVKVATDKAYASGTKPSNPKDIFGSGKASLSMVPSAVLIELALGMQEGALKYGRHNYRVIGVRGSIYYDAAIRHLMAWWEGEDQDPESGASLHHVSKAIASLTVLRDAMINGKFTDDRPPKLPATWLSDANATAKALNERALANHFEPVKPYTQVEGENQISSPATHPEQRRPA